MKKAGKFDDETIIVTKNEDAAGRVAAIKPDRDANKAKDAKKRILSSKVKLGKVTIRELVDDGRRY
jgi:hypothetical protein